MHLSSFFRTVTIAMLLGAASCRCDEGATCPAFDAASAPYRLANDGESISFRDDAGRQIVFRATSPFVSPGYSAMAKQQPLGGCVVEACDARASSEALTSESRGGFRALTVQYMTSSDGLNGQRFET